MSTNDLETGKYSSKISKKASKIEKTAKSRKIRRLVFLCIILMVCLGGIIIGVSSKSQSIETQYKNYVDAPDMSALNNELLSYKDVFDLFEANFLGNKACQSLMGGFFYDGADYSIYPNETGDRMILHSEESEVTLCDGLASDINVADGIVYFRKLNSRVISTYSISDKKTSKLPLKNVGQFIICDSKIYYIDLSSSALKLFDMATAEIEEIIQGSVSSFVVIGNNILFLCDDHTLNEMNLSDHTQTVIAKNISAFSYDGELWIQNKEKVYTKSLGKESLKECTFDIQCNRLLGVTKIYVFFESTDGIYVYNTETGMSQKVNKGTFVGASDKNVLVCNSLDRYYYVISLDDNTQQNIDANSENNNEDIVPSDTLDKTIISFSRQTAGYIKPEDKPRVDPFNGYWGRILYENEENKIKSADLLSVGQEVVVDNISFTLTKSVFSEKEGNFADSQGFAPYYDVYVVLSCDIKNNDTTSPCELSSKFSFKLIEGGRHLFDASSIDEKEYYSYYHEITPNTQINDATISFRGSRSLITNSDDIIVELLCGDEPIAYWKIEPAFVN